LPQVGLAAAGALPWSDPVEGARHGLPRRRPRAGAGVAIHRAVAPMGGIASVGRQRCVESPGDEPLRQGLPPGLAKESGRVRILLQSLVSPGVWRCVHTGHLVLLLEGSADNQ
jgi:hypothetical protein